MQNGYTGDIGDYGKYGLLRILSKNLKLGVVWYLVPNEIHKNDGKLTHYAHMQNADPILYSKLQKILLDQLQDL